MGWMSTSGWATQGGSLLGTNRRIPKGSDLYSIARVIEDQHIDALLVIGFGISPFIALPCAFTLAQRRRCQWNTCIQVSASAIRCDFGDDGCSRRLF
jgi:hypothetical protein